MRTSPGVVPRLEFFVIDYAGNPVPNLSRTDFSAFAYSLITEGLYGSPVTVTPSSNVASTAAKSAGQFVTINSAKGHYAVDCPSGAASSAATHVEISATPNVSTHGVYPVRSEIDTKISTLFESVSGSTAPTVERSPTDTKVLTFAWPVSGATITATVSKDNGSYAATVGTVTFLRTEGGKHFYQLSYNAADRPTSEGTARYKFVDGTYTRYVNLRVAVAGGGGGGGPSGFTAVVVSRLPVGSTAGWPKELTIGDAYLAATASSEILFVKDIDDNILSALGTKTFSDADFIGTLRLSPLTDGTRELDSPPTTIEVTSADNPGIVYNDDTAGAEFFHLQIPRAKTLLGVTKTRYSVQFIMNWGVDASFERTIHLGETKFLRKNAPAT